MIISRTPFRVSFFGGGTDYPAWFEENGGSVLATTINKYCYISCRYLPPFFDHKSRIIYSKMEHVKKVSDIDHPSVREVLRFLKLKQGVEIHHDGDLPARTGPSIPTSTPFDWTRPVPSCTGTSAWRSSAPDDSKTHFRIWSALSFRTGARSMSARG